MTCPAPQPGFTPRAIMSPSALRADADCRASWGRSNLEGRRFNAPAYEDLPPPPPKAAKGASAVEKKRASQALKAYNRPMRLSLGTSTHAIFEAYYLQKVPGAWRAPRLWLDLSVAWNSRPGQIALSGRAHLPDPSSLAWVACEELVTVAPVPGWAGPWPKLGGTPDLVTRGVLPYRFHLYDYKTTLSISLYAKTAEELHDHDEQAAIYALAVMQENGLEILDCTWVYMQTEGKPKSQAVHFTMTRAHAEARVRDLAAQALELEQLTVEYLALPRGFLGDGKRLALLQSLPTNTLACGNYAGCPFHSKEGGPCKPKKLGLGSAMRASAEREKQKADRTAAAKESKERDIMLNAEQKARKAELLALGGQKDRNFKQNQELLKLEKLEKADAPAEGEGSTDGATETIETKGEEVSEKPPADKPKPTTAAKPAAPTSDALRVVCGEVDFELPQKSPFFKPIMVAVKAFAAAKAALAGES